MEFIFVDNYVEVIEAIFQKTLKFKKPWLFKSFALNNLYIK